MADLEISVLNQVLERVVVERAADVEYIGASSAADYRHIEIDSRVNYYCNAMIFLAPRVPIYHQQDLQDFTADLLKDLRVAPDEVDQAQLRPYLLREGDLLVPFFSFTTPVHQNTRAIYSYKELDDKWKSDEATLLGMTVVDIPVLHDFNRQMYLLCYPNNHFAIHAWSLANHISVNEKRRDLNSFESDLRRGIIRRSWIDQQLKGLDPLQVYYEELKNKE
jgi:hypothetical protein